MDAPSDEIISPCIGACIISDDNRYCLMCNRTTKEITVWSCMTDEQRKEVMKRLEEDT